MKEGTIVATILVCALVSSILASWINLSNNKLGSPLGMSGNSRQLSQEGSSSQSGTTPKVVYDESYFTITSDSKNWPVGNLIAKNASVPEIIELSQNLGSFKKGDILVYFIDFANYSGVVGSEKLSFVYSKDDGKTWSDRTQINLQNKQNKGAAVDPSVVQLSDGKLRLYFFGSDISSSGAPAGTNVNNVYSALSSDGVNFTVEQGVRFSDRNLTDPEVIYFKNQWFMYYSTGENSKLAVSNDGLNFNQETLSGSVGGVPGALALDNGVRVYGCAFGGVKVSFASDGKTFTKESGDVFGGKVAACDPSIVKSQTGQFFAVYKVNNNQK